MVKYSSRSYSVLMANMSSALCPSDVVKVFSGERRAEGPRGLTTFIDTQVADGNFPVQLRTDCDCTLRLLEDVTGCKEAVEEDDPRAQGIKPKPKPRRPYGTEKYLSRTYAVIKLGKGPFLKLGDKVAVVLNSSMARAEEGRTVHLRCGYDEFIDFIRTDCGCELKLSQDTSGCEIGVPRRSKKPRIKQHEPDLELGSIIAAHLEPYKEQAVKPNAGVFAGGKDDADKLIPSLLYSGVPNALEAVLHVLMGGAKKYSAHSWQKVEDGINRYWEAAGRHKLDIDKHGLRAVNVKDFGLLDLDHMIINLLFVRELMFLEDQAAK